MSDQYAVSIRHSYTMPDETFYGYELVLWHWDVIENTWLFRATREYPVSRPSHGNKRWNRRFTTLRNWLESSNAKTMEPTKKECGEAVSDVRA